MSDSKDAQSQNETLNDMRESDEDASSAGSADSPSSANTIIEDFKENEVQVAEEPEGPIHAIRISRVNVVCVVISIILVAIVVFLSGSLIDAIGKSDKIHTDYDECSQAATELMIASDKLTTQARMFVVTGDREYLDAYLDELLVQKNRDKAVEILNHSSEDASAAAELTQALSESNNLAIFELYAMRLTCDAWRINPLPEAISIVVLEPEDEMMSLQEKEKLARDMLLGEKYGEMKSLIEQDVSDCANELVQTLQHKEKAIESYINRLIIALVLVAILLMGLIAFASIINYKLLLQPMKKQEANVEHGRPLEEIGSFEIRSIARSYNKMFKIVQERTSYLKHEAETDSLTGLLNRGSYDRFLDEIEGDYALVLADIDHFKTINDTYGHVVGDEVLKKVAGIISPQFRATDKVCRIGGDEFAVIMPGVKAANRDVIAPKLEMVAENLDSIEDDLPEVSLSFGVAFKDTLQFGDNIYHAADKSLYRAKHLGRNCYHFSGDES